MTEFAITFPGQGSQSIGMLSDLHASFAVVGETFEEASETLGKDLWQLVAEGPAEDLNQTVNTQPAMLAAGIAVWRVWQAQGGAVPTLMAGHSLGEYSALVAGEAIAFSDAVRLVGERGRLMQQAVPSGQGAMAAILGLADDEVRAVCEKAAADEVAEAVNYNSPGQVVIAGNVAAIKRAVDLAKEAGAKRALMLDVSVPSHCRLMRGAAEELFDLMQSMILKAPKIPVIHNVNVSVSQDADEIRELLKQQLFSPVRWVETVQAIAARGIDHLVEAGPGKVLTGLSKRIDRSLTGLAVFDGPSLQKALETING